MSVTLPSFLGRVFWTELEQDHCSPSSLVWTPNWFPLEVQEYREAIFDAVTSLIYRSGRRIQDGLTRWVRRRTLKGFTLFCQGNPFRWALPDSSLSASVPWRDRSSELEVPDYSSPLCTTPCLESYQLKLVVVFRSCVFHGKVFLSILLPEVCVFVCACAQPRGHGRENLWVLGLWLFCISV